MEDNNTLTYNNQSIFTVPKNVFSNLAESSLTELPNHWNKYNRESTTKSLKK